MWQTLEGASGGVPSSPRTGIGESVGSTPLQRMNDTGAILMMMADSQLRPLQQQPWRCCRRYTGNTRPSTCREDHAGKQERCSSCCAGRFSHESCYLLPSYLASVCLCWRVRCNQIKKVNLEFSLHLLRPDIGWAKEIHPVRIDKCLFVFVVFFVGQSGSPHAIYSREQRRAALSFAFCRIPRRHGCEQRRQAWTSVRWKHVFSLSTPSSKHCSRVCLPRQGCPSAAAAAAAAAVSLPPSLSSS